MNYFFVRQDGSGTHTEIMAAVYDAQPGDVISVGNGTFNENIDLYKGVSIEGNGQDYTVIQGSLETSVVRSYTCALGSTTLTMTGGTAGLKKGRLFTGSGIPANARIVDVQPTSITISAATTAARTTATSGTMPAVEATVRIRGSGSNLRNLKIVGFDNPNPASEMSAVYYRNAGAGSAAASNQSMENCWLVADGEYALLTDSTASVTNLLIQNNKFTGKTFVGDYPATGNQFTVPNVPRQLVTIQSANTAVIFRGNQIEGTTGGVTADGVTMSFNTAATVDAGAAIVENNVVKSISGYGYGLRVRGASAMVSGNSIHTYSPYSSAGFLISGAGAIDSGNQVIAVLAQMVSTYVSPGQPVGIEMDQSQVASIPKVAADPQFSSPANWRAVTYVFKKAGSSQRLVSHFKNFDEQRQMKLRPGMQGGERFELHKVIVSKGVDRQLLVMKRDEVPNASQFDFTLL